MNIWLDDNPIRDPKQGDWKICRVAESCIDLLESGDHFGVIDLDHDLGPEIVCGSGVDVLKWLTNEALEKGKIPCNEIRVHTNNPVRHAEMLLMVDDINKIVSKNTL